MGLRAAMNAGLFRFTRDGRRVLTPFSVLRLRRIYYLVPDAELRGVERRYSQIFWGVVFLAFLAPLVVPKRPWSFVLLGNLGLQLVTRFWLPHCLERIELESTDFPPLDRQARALSRAQAVGEPTLWVLLFGTALMGAGQIAILITDAAWWAWIGIALFGSAAIVMGRQLYLLRRYRPPPVS